MRFPYSMGISVTFAPFFKASYIYYSGDDPTTADNEGFDPLFYGWKDWGQWFVGSINSWTLSPTNQQATMLEAGLYPSQTTMFRAQYYDFDLDYESVPGAGTNWSREIDLILDWFPSETLFFGAAMNFIKPNESAKAFYGDDKDVTEIVLWGGVIF